MSEEIELAQERLRRSINALERLHAVLIGFAMTAGARTFMEPWLARPASGAPDPSFPMTAFLLFAALFFTIVPFFHGATRHLDLVHLYAQRPPYRLHLLIDYALLFLEGIIFIVIGLSVYSITHFVSAVYLLLAIDTAWGIVTSLLAEPPARAHIKKWIYLNIGTAVAMLGLFRIDTPYVPTVLFVGALLRTVIDYTANWRVFFDVPTASIVAVPLNEE